MTFEAPNAVAAMNNAVAAVGEDGDSWEIVGDPLTKLVDEEVPAYDEKLDLKLDPSPGAKRAEISTMRWGKITKDVARLTGLVRALENISAVIKSGKDTIALDWQGEAFDAFRVSVEKVEKTLDDYAGAVRTTADGLARTLAGAQQIFTTYRDDTREKHLAFEKCSPPADWRRMTNDDAEFFAEHCTSHAGLKWGSNCHYNDDPQVAMINRKLTNTRLHDQVEKWDCTGDGGVVVGQYRYLVDSAYDEREHIQTKIHQWYVATDKVKTTIGDALDEALNNLRIIAELKVFATFSVPGATAPAGPQGGDPGPGGGGDPGPGGDGDYPGDGEAEMPEPAPEPEPEPAPEPDAEPAPVDPVAGPETTDPESADSDGTEPAASDGPTPGTVEIKDGDRTISISSPDGVGQIKVTVTDGDGAKSYLLDFDAASGMSRPEEDAAAPEEGVEQVPARSDGKCVIQSGDVVITAERPLFSPDALTVKIDDGAGSVTTYTVDLPEEPGADTGTAAPQPASEAAPSASQSTQTATTTGQPVATEDDAGQGEGKPVEAPAVRQTPTQEPDQATTPQALVNDQRGSLSGVLETDQQDGEAGLASASDAPATSDAAPPDASHSAIGMAGAGVPGAGMSNGSDNDAGRAGSGWSVHGDLFDSGEPVYSVHGVLGEDDLESQ